MILDKLQKTFRKSVDTLASFVKIPLMSGRPSPRSSETKDTIIIMGNGPSLRDAIDRERDVLMAFPRLAVNFSALTPDFRELRPDYYILADIAFFAAKKTGNVPKLWESLRSVDWQMTLFLPAKARKMPEVGSLPGNIRIRWYNLTPAEGFTPVMRWLYDSGYAMPRPRNVLIPAIMSSMREGFRRIVLIGADHNWARTLWVTDRNKVVSVQPHFYKDNDKELKRVEQVGATMHLHQMYESLSIAFRSYFDIKDYADRRGITIINSTPASFIDAFPRAPL